MEYNHALNVEGGSYEHVKGTRAIEVTSELSFSFRVSVIENGFNFTIFSQHAISVALCLSFPDKGSEAENDKMMEFKLDSNLNKTVDIRHVCVEYFASFRSTPKRRIYHETYGCQMNDNDMEIVVAIMKKSGYDNIVEAPESAEIIFINTCAIRDNAEQTVWQRLKYFWFLKRQWKNNVAQGRSESVRPT